MRRHGSTSWSNPVMLSGHAYQSQTHPGFAELGIPFSIDNYPAVAATSSHILVVWSDGSASSEQQLRSVSMPW